MTAAKRPSVATLLDANVLIALVVDDHVHHDAAETWFSASSGRFATCPSTEGSLTRDSHPRGPASRRRTSGYRTALSEHTA